MIVVNAVSPMKQHVSILGTLYIVFGCLGLLGAFALLLFFGGVAGIVGIAAHEDPDAAVAVPIVGGLGVGLAALVTLFSIPGLVVGIGLVKFRRWARVGGAVLSAINLVNFPLGTAIGAYGLWVLLSKESEPLFA
ncbi:MAG TPA: hypothetical protein VIG29_18820 [Vicinamibacteria bacterium]|jgi:hypothetical protein